MSTSAPPDPGPLGAAQPAARRTPSDAPTLPPDAASPAVEPGSTTAGLGPQPARTDRPREAALRVLRALASAGDAVTVIALTADLGGHPNSVRMQLEHLVADGFAVEEAAPASGRGRPPRGYRATLAGRQVAGQEDGWDASSTLVAAVAEQLASGDDPTGQARALGRRWGRRLKGADADLVHTLAAQGFAPHVTGDGIELRTCPLLETAHRLPAVVCSIHQGLIDELAGEPLRLIPFARPGACLIVPPAQG